MQLILGAGPQYTDLRNGITSPQWSVSGRAILRYRFEHASLVASWEKLTSSGSGYFGGANTQAAQLAYNRSLGRTYRLNVVASYAHNKSLQPSSVTSATSYNSGTAAATLRKHIGRTYDVFAAFGFDEVGFNAANTEPNCGSPNGIGCGSIARRYTGSIGLEWHPKATRIE